MLDVDCPILSLVAIAHDADSNNFLFRCRPTRTLLAFSGICIRLSVLWMASGILYLLALLFGMTVFKFFFFGRFGHTQIWNNHADSIPFIHVIIPSLFFVVSILGIAAIIVGYGLSQRASWARVAAIVFGCLALLKFPLGTALGIYTLWVLAPTTSALEYDSIGTLPSA